MMYLLSKSKIVCILLGVCGLVRSAQGLEFSKNPTEAPDENSILATGNIEPDDAFRLQTYLAKLPQRAGMSMFLDSGGGSVQGAIAVGRVVHEINIRTYVTGPTAKCISACTSIFLAGRDRASGAPFRVKGSNNRIGFHNFVPTLEDKAFTAKDAANVVARAQHTIYELATYFQQVDADLELLGLGLKQKTVYDLQNQDALRLGIHVLDAKTNELVRYESYQRFVKP